MSVRTPAPPTRRTQSVPDRGKIHPTASREDARRRRLRRLALYRWSRALAVVFIAWHLFAVSVWLVCNEAPSALGGVLLPIVRPYMTLTGFKQGWHMFGPQPSRLDVYVEARLTYANGRTAHWEFPRLATLNYAARVRQERYRKLIELGHGNSAGMVWPSLARYAARRNDPDPHNPPVAVELVRYFRQTPPPGAPWPSFQSVSFYRTAITAADLR